MNPVKPTLPTSRRTLLGMMLVERGLLTAEQLAPALELQKKTGEYLGMLLVRQGLVSEAQLMQVLAEQVGMTYVALEQEHFTK